MATNRDIKARQEALLAEYKRTETRIELGREQSPYSPEERCQRFEEEFGQLVIESHRADGVYGPSYLSSSNSQTSLAMTFDGFPDTKGPLIRLPHHPDSPPLSDGNISPTLSSDDLDIDMEGMGINENPGPSQARENGRHSKKGQRKRPEWMEGGPFIDPSICDTYYYQSYASGGTQINGDILRARCQPPARGERRFYDRMYCDDGEQINGRVLRGEPGREH
jgi:hypothetical protein